ncbi:MAG: hypothetical protein HWE23_11505 [Rhodobacteraceae bacterium]|nr:hypothetical protein [Paracoccaceae bacterium]
MPFILRKFGDRYSPLYFLAALGAGGLMVTFFMYLMFWVPHPGRAVPIFEDMAAVLQGQNTALKAAVWVAYVGIGFFALMHFRLLIWNVSEYLAFRKTDAWKTLVSGNAETQLMAIPLTLAMSINAGFILGLVFVPGLWNVVEYLFPIAMLAFLAVGVLAFRIMGAFFGRVLSQGGFDCSKNNSFAQMLPAFAIAMVGVGLAAPAAMSATKWIMATSYILSTFFIVAAVIMGTVALFLGFRSMLENGAQEEGAPTLWVAIPIMTVVAIALMRQDHGMHVQLGSRGNQADLFEMLTTMVSVQLLFALLGFLVLRRVGYFAKYVFGHARSAGSYALVCPGVAMSVLLQFWINKGLVGGGIMEKFSTGYLALTAVAIALQIVTIALVFHLNASHFAGKRSDPALKATVRGA